jgi:hypothetical protein
MNRLILLLIIGFSFYACREKENSSIQWIQLYNGKDLVDWHVKIKGYPLDENYGNTFRVENGNLKVSYDHYKNFDAKFGHIFYKEKFSYYLLAVEYRFTGEQISGGPDWAYRNSGAMIHSQAPESLGLDQDFPISIEVQLQGGNGKDERHTANLCTPGTNVVMDGKLFTNHCVDSNSKTFHGDQWVRVEVLVLGDSVIKHIVEGDTVLTYAKPQIGAGDVSNYKPEVKVDGKLLTEGYIALQSESHPVEFRKVELFDLSPYKHNKEKLQKTLAMLRSREN